MTSAPLTHEAFCQAFRAGSITIEIEPKPAARFVSARLMLPFFALPVLGAGVGLALIGWLATGLAVIALGIIVPRLIKRGAPRFILTQSLQDAGFYEDAVTAGILKIEAASADVAL